MLHDRYEGRCFEDKCIGSDIVTGIHRKNRFQHLTESSALEFEDLVGKVSGFQSNAANLVLAALFAKVSCGACAKCDLRYVHVGLAFLASFAKHTVHSFSFGFPPNKYICGASFT